jgi:hypothetical protein
MAHALRDEDIADVTIAVALLTSGVVHQYAKTDEQARALVTGLRHLEDQFIARTLNVKSFQLQ